MGGHASSSSSRQHSPQQTVSSRTGVPSVSMRQHPRTNSAVQLRIISRCSPIIQNRTKRACAMWVRPPERRHSATAGGIARPMILDTSALGDMPRTPANGPTRSSKPILLTTVLTPKHTTDPDIQRHLTTLRLEKYSAQRHVATSPEPASSVL